MKLERGTLKQRERIERMIDDGLSAKEISRKLNINKMSVAGVMAWRKHPKAFKNVGRKAMAV